MVRFRPLARSWFEAAIKDFSKSIELDPKVSTPYLDRARAYQALNQLDKARADMDMALKYYSGKEKIGVNNRGVYFTYGNNLKPNSSQKKLGQVGKALSVALRGNLSASSGEIDEEEIGVKPHLIFPRWSNYPAGAAKRLSRRAYGAASV